eukprot:2393750-Pleurochrysis_carterae.AAC.1
MGIQAEEKRCSKSPSLCTGLRTNPRRGLRPDVLRDDASDFTTHISLYCCQPRPAHAEMGLRGRLPSGRAAGGRSC